MAKPKEVKYKVFNGLRNDVQPERFSRGDMLTATNIDIDSTGRISRRAGYTQRNAAPAHSLWANDQLSVFVSGAQLLKLNADYSVAALAAVSGGRLDYCAVGERVYFTGANDTGVIEDGAVRTWGMAVPALPTATAMSGQLDAGIYQFTLTHTRDDGQESGAMAAGTITLGDGMTIEFNLPALNDPTIVARSIYLTPPNGDALFQAISLPTALRTYMLVKLDIDMLTLPLVTQFLQPAPAGQLVAYYKGRMFVASGSILYMSEPFAYEQFDLRNYIDLDAPITMLATVEDKPGSIAGLFIGTEKSTGVLTGSGPQDFDYAPKVNYGAVLGALAYMDGTLLEAGEIGARQIPIWLSTQGVCVGIPRMDVVNHTRGRYDVALTGPGAATFNPETSQFVATSATTTLVACTEYKPANDGAMAVSTFDNFPFNSFACVGGVRLGASSAGVFELTGETDNGVPIDAIGTLGISDFGLSFIKGMERVYIGYRSFGDMLLRVTTDERATFDYPLAARVNPGIQSARVPIGKGLRGRYWQFDLLNVDGCDFDLDMLEVMPAECDRRIRA